MGAEASTESGEEFLRGFQNKYSFTKEINDSRFGDIQIYKENGGDGYVFLKSNWCQSEEDYNQFLKQCQRRVNSPQRNVLKMIGYTQSSDSQLCGDFSKITVYYEYYPHNMERELDRRHTRSEYFNEQEIWFLLESVISACAYFEQQKIYHGDLRPQNILLTNEGFVKIADHGLIHSDKNGYIKALQYGEQAYLSPILMRALQNRETSPGHNVFKSDVYSLGMTMLEVANLYTARSCYDFNTSQIIRPVVDDLLNRARQRYSQFLMNIIQELVQEDEAQRPTFIELSSLLAPYQEQIQNLQPFTPDYNLVRSAQAQPQYIQPQAQAPVQVVQSQAQPAYSVPQQQLGAQSQVIYSNGQPYIQSPEKQRYQQNNIEQSQITGTTQIPQAQTQVLAQSMIPQQLTSQIVYQQQPPQQQQQTQYIPQQQQQTNSPTKYSSVIPQNNVQQSYIPQQNTVQSSVTPQPQYQQQQQVYPQQQQQAPTQSLPQYNPPQAAPAAQNGVQPPQPQYQQQQSFQQQQQQQYYPGSTQQQQQPQAVYQNQQQQYQPQQQYY